MSKGFWTGIAGLALVGAWFLALETGAASVPQTSTPSRNTQTDPERMIDERSAPYYEDEDDRAVAQMFATLVRTDAGVHIEYRASAFGVHIVPPPGHEGVPGSNLTSAREIDALLADTKVGATVRNEVTGETLALSIFGADKRHVPLRRVQKNGRIDFDATSEDAYMSTVKARSGALPAGRYVLQITAKGSPRAHARFVVRNGGGKVLLLEGIGHPLQRGKRKESE